MRRTLLWLSAGAALLFSTGTAAAQEASQVAPETAFVFNTFLFLIAGMVVMFMAAGFCMLEVGLVRSKNAGVICLKNIALYSIAGLMFWFIGYNLAYPGEFNGVLGFAGAFWNPADEAPLDTGYAASSDWYFQMVFVATAASIVSGTLAERIKLWPFLAFVAVLTGVIYPIQASWEWGSGWLDNLGFSDFAGSTLVHSVGGWAALAGVLLLGPRTGKYGPNGEVVAMPGSNLPLATLGTFILWFGWFGFNGGSVLALGSLDAATQVADVFVNTNIAAASGVLGAMVVSQVLFSRPVLPFALNGAIGGLVAITAEPLTPSLPLAAFIGVLGGVTVVFGTLLLDKLKIDDVVGAIPAHLFAGVLGTLVVPLSNPEASFGVQLLGVVSIGAFVFLVSLAVWAALKYTIGIRACDKSQEDGLDRAEMGISAYPEFSLNGAADVTATHVSTGPDTGLAGASA
ncbi:ammonium transporter family protein [Parvularcula lutaonensis]|uniref:Ammonium transporter n=1 Tax=Parvularcula lutaonensis TaxID=491923 RepID=A0ABV7MD15_9PROT|nr:ammonium transporter [Parvularcula lutaonensis]GGY52038.1 ammonium transporter [Parvularcula lutaonensis]